MKPQDIELIRIFLIDRYNVEFNLTKFEQSPMKLPLNEILINKEIINEKVMNKFQLISTNLLLKYRIYYHYKSDKIIINCENNTSFCINNYERLNEFEIKDFLIRSFEGLNQQDIEIKYQEINKEIRNIRCEYLNNDNNSNNKIDDQCIIPLLPIFIGYFNNKTKELKNIDFSDSKNYKANLRNLVFNNNKDIEFKLIQKVENNNNRILGDLKFNKEINLIIRKAIKYKISRKTFKPRIIRYALNYYYNKVDDCNKVEDDIVNNKGYELIKNKRIRLNNVLLKRLSTQKL